MILLFNGWMFTINLLALMLTMIPIPTNGAPFHIFTSITAFIFSLMKNFMFGYTMGTQVVLMLSANLYFVAF